VPRCVWRIPKCAHRENCEEASWKMDFLFRIYIHTYIYILEKGLLLLFFIWKSNSATTWLLPPSLNAIIVKRRGAMLIYIYRWCKYTLDAKNIFYSLKSLTPSIQYKKMSIISSIICRKKNYLFIYSNILLDFFDLFNSCTWCGQHTPLRFR